MSSEPVTTLDASFVVVEDEVNHMSIALVQIFEGPPPTLADLRDGIAARLPLVPRFRKKLRLAPVSVVRPMWVDDADFSVDYHVRRAALPSPGDEAELATLVGRIMEHQLDRRRPLWEAWMVEGLTDDHWAIIFKVHHALTDGIGGAHIMAAFLDLQPEAVTPPVDDWHPAPEPTARQQALGSLMRIWDAPRHRLEMYGDAARHPLATAARLTELRRGLALLFDAPSAPPSMLTGPLGPHRDYRMTTVSLADVGIVRKALGGTVNDVILTISAGGIRALLHAAGEPIERRTVRTMVPVSIRPADLTEATNLASAVYASLPVCIEDPVERLAEVHRHMDEVKRSPQRAAADALVAAVGQTPPMVAALIARFLVHHSIGMETVVTNIPGPQFPLYAFGRKMVAGYPYVPVSGRSRLGIAVFSYLGFLHFGVSADADTRPHLDACCQAIEDDMNSLVKAAEAVGAAGRPDDSETTEEKVTL